MECLETNNNLASNDIFNLFFVSKFPLLKHMYLKEAEEVRNEKAVELYKGWQEWHQLDDESKAFLYNPRYRMS